MKKTGDPIYFEREPRGKVEIGKLYGHLEAVEEVKRAGQSAKHFRCICRNVREGRECGNLRVMRSYNLLSSRGFRACAECTAEHIRAARRRFNNFLITTARNY